MTPAPATPAVAPEVPGVIPTAPPTAFPTARQPFEPLQRFVFRGVDWRSYRAILDAAGERRLRAAYDGWSLEIMTTSRIHDKFSRLIGRLIVTLTEELGLPIDSAGSTTLDRADVERGIEPDECFYLKNEPLIRGKREIDLTVDPPPDLAIEIDVSRSSVSRLPIYARLGVPEVWRFDGESLHVYVRGADGEYAVRERGINLPMLRPADLLPFLQQEGQTDENALIRSFRAWFREQIARGWQPAS